MAEYVSVGGVNVYRFTRARTVRMTENGDLTLYYETHKRSVMHSVSIYTAGGELLHRWTRQASATDKWRGSSSQSAGLGWLPQAFRFYWGGEDREGNPTGAQWVRVELQVYVTPMNVGPLGIGTLDRSVFYMAFTAPSDDPPVGGMDEGIHTFSELPDIGPDETPNPPPDKATADVGVILAVGLMAGSIWMASRKG